MWRHFVSSSCTFFFSIMHLINFLAPLPIQLGVLHFVRSDVSCHRRYKKKRQNLCFCSAQIFTYINFHTIKHVHLNASWVFSYKYSILVGQRGAGLGAEPKVADRSWRRVNSFNDGRHDSSACVCACLPGFIDHVRGLMLKVFKCSGQTAPKVTP